MRGADSTVEFAATDGSANAVLDLGQIEDDGSREKSLTKIKAVWPGGLYHMTIITNSEAAAMQARAIMTTKVVCISHMPGISHAVAMMLQNHVSGLPVVGDLNRVCGMVTEGDLLLPREVRFAPSGAGAGAVFQAPSGTLYWRQRMVRRGRPT